MVVLGEKQVGVSIAVEVALEGGEARVGTGVPDAQLAKRLAVVDGAVHAAGVEGGTHRGVVVVAVSGLLGVVQAGGLADTGAVGGDPVPVSVVVVVVVLAVIGEGVVGLGITVVAVGRVAVLVHPGVDQEVGVVTVRGIHHAVEGVGHAVATRAGGSIAVAITVQVVVATAKSIGVVRVPIAVIVVGGVAGLGTAWMDSVQGIVAVGAVRDIAAGRCAGVCRHCCVSEAVAVHIRVEGGGHVLVDVPVAVVVHLVADLGGARVDARVGVVAVVE